MVHHEADMPERYMREVHEASGWRARFVAYEVVAKYWDVPMHPGAVPAPTGRFPTEAVAALKMERDKEAEKAVAAAVGVKSDLNGSGVGAGAGSGMNVESVSLDCAGGDTRVAEVDK